MFRPAICYVGCRVVLRFLHSNQIDGTAVSHFWLGGRIRMIISQHRSCSKRNKAATFLLINEQKRSERLLFIHFLCVCFRPIYTGLSKAIRQLLGHTSIKCRGSSEICSSAIRAAAASDPELSPSHLHGTDNINFRTHRGAATLARLLEMVSSVNQKRLAKIDRG